LKEAGSVDPESSTNLYQINLYCLTEDRNQDQENLMSNLWKRISLFCSLRTERPGFF